MRTGEATEDSYMLDSGLNRYITVANLKANRPREEKTNYLTHMPNKSYLNTARDTELSL